MSSSSGVVPISISSTTFLKLRKIVRDIYSNLDGIITQSRISLPSGSMICTRGKGKISIACLSTTYGNVILHLQTLKILSFTLEAPDGRIGKPLAILREVRDVLSQDVEEKDEIDKDSEQGDKGDPSQEIERPHQTILEKDRSNIEEEGKRNSREMKDEKEQENIEGEEIDNTNYPQYSFSVRHPMSHSTSFIPDEKLRTTGEESKLFELKIIRCNGWKNRFFIPGRHFILSMMKGEIFTLIGMTTCEGKLRSPTADEIKIISTTLRFNLDVHESVQRDRQINIPQLALVHMMGYACIPDRMESRETLETLERRKVEDMKFLQRESRFTKSVRDILASYTLPRDDEGPIYRVIPKYANKYCEASLGVYLVSLDCRVKKGENGESETIATFDIRNHLTEACMIIVVSSFVDTTEEAYEGIGISVNFDDLEGKSDALSLLEKFKHVHNPFRRMRYS